MNENIMRKAGFGKEVDLVKKGLCPFCRKPVKMEEFRDALSMKEFKISGLCQLCQNETFNFKRR